MTTLHASGLLATFQPGDVLRAGRYEIQTLLRHGPKRDVYLAHDQKLDCQVALDRFSTNAIMPSGLTAAAWETSVLGRLGDHPNIGTVLDQWEDGGSAFMVSRYLSGGSLRDLIARQLESGEPLAVQEIVRLAIEIARGLGHVHHRGMLHRDVQPRNVLLDRWGTAHLVDFDLAVSVDEKKMSDISDRPVVAYMAPEAADSVCLDERADLYSLGATIYEMCAGSPPRAAQRDCLSVAIEREDLPDGLRELVFRLLSAEPEQRPASAAEVVETLGGLHAARADLDRFLTSDETTTLEFKASLRTAVGPRVPGDQRPAGLRRLLEREVIETLAAFLNTDGGTMLIGVEDDHNVIGIEVDYPLVRGSRDGWRCAFGHVVNNALDTHAQNRIDLQLEPCQGRTIAVIRCHPGRGKATWINDDLYVRRNGYTEKLCAKDAVEYCQRFAA
jgi:hypothetical protein